jgi:hypothetical protein
LWGPWGINDQLEKGVIWAPETPPKAWGWRGPTLKMSDGPASLSDLEETSIYKKRGEGKYLQMNPSLTTYIFDEFMICYI